MHKDFNTNDQFRTNDQILFLFFGGKKRKNFQKFRRSDCLARKFDFGIFTRNYLVCGNSRGE